jgi:ABC-type sugar transport system permease subunit
MFWKITLPMITPILLITLVYTIVDSFAASSSKIIEYIGKIMFDKSDFEYAAAMGWIYFVIIILFVAVAYACLAPAIRNVSEN